LRLIDAHPRLAAEAAQVAATRAGVDVAGAVPNPSVEGRVGQGRPRIGDGSQLEWGANLNVPLGWLAQRGPRVSVARAQVDVATADARTMRRDVLLQMQEVFWKLVFEQARVESLEALHSQTAALATTVRKKVEAGEARPIEATRVEIEVEKMAAEVESARASLMARRSQLALGLGLPAEAPVLAVADLGLLPPLAVDEAPVPHLPTVQAAQARARALELDVRVEKRARLPGFALTGFTASELDRKSYGLGLAVDVPLWNWNAGRIAQAEARLTASRKQADAVALEVQSAIVEARSACRGSVATATRLGTAVVPRAETSATTIEKTYRLGEASLLELIDSRRTLLEARRLHLNALGQAQLDCGRLKVLTDGDIR
jgi:cobalt-zinc-cadmium efflux system outer membrane protein